jgi:mannonate dehydratase
MHRRNFIAACGGTLLAAQGRTTAAPAAPAPRKLQMHLGTQQGPTTPEMLDYFRRHGVRAICAYPPVPKNQGYWTREDLERTRDLCEKHEIALEMVALPFLSSGHIDRDRRGAIQLAQDPERGRDIECIQHMIAACAQAGVPAIKYNLSLLGVLRTAATPGRGGSRYSTWRLAEARQEPPLTRAGRITADLFWERITYFLDRVVPVCNQHKIRMACHPHDPGVPPEGFQGVCCVLGTPEGLRRFVSIQESPYHGLNFCVGTVAEMLRKPGEEIFDILRYFGSRKKIFNIHFRNIRGRRDDFQEVFPDEGDLNMVQVARTLREVDYPYMVMPDHVPSHPDDPRGLQAFAYANGYIQGILQALDVGP